MSESETENPKRYSWQQEFGSQFSGCRVLVTGATGFVGSYLNEALLSLGAEVYGTEKKGFSHNEAEGIRFISVDLSDQQAVKRMVDISNPDLTYHLAALVDTRQEIDLVFPTLQHNLISTLNLLTALVDRKCHRIVVTSSSETPLDEQAPNSPYAASKLAMTVYAKMFHRLYGLPIVIARPHMNYGPRQPQNKLIPYVICSILKNTPALLSSGRRICDLVYVKDLVRALLLLGTARDVAVGCTFDIGTGIGTSIKEIAAYIAALMRANCTIMFSALPDRVGEFPQVANIKKISEDLGWQPYWTMNEGLIETIEYYKEHLDA